MYVHLKRLGLGLGLLVRLLGLCLMAGGTFSCGSDTILDSADAGSPSVEIGTGQRNFEGLNNGDTIFIVQGPQDGYHLTGSLRAKNINIGNSKDLSDSDNPKTIFEIFVDNKRVDAQASTYVQGLRLREHGAEMLGRNVILDIEDDSELAGMMVRFTVRVEDVDGVIVSDERTLKAIPHPNNQ